MCHYGERAVFWLCTICNYFLLLVHHILFVSTIWAMVFQILSPFRAVDQCSYNSSPSSTIPHFFLRPITNSGWFMPPMIGGLFATTPPACPEAQLGRAQRSIGWLTYWTVRDIMCPGGGQTWKSLQTECRFVLSPICSQKTYITYRVKAGKIYHQLSGQGIWWPP